MEASLIRSNVPGALTSTGANPDTIRDSKSLAKDEKELIGLNVRNGEIASG
jgi:hypothetical protein